MSCTRDTPRCPKTTDPNTGRLFVPPCCRTHIRNLFHAALGAMVKAGVFVWLDYGTLLGAVREGNFIDHDDDADFSILIKDKDLAREALQKVADENGYDLRSAFLDDGMQLYLSKNNALHIDVFFWHEEGDYYDRNSYVKGTDDNKGKKIPKSWVHPLSYTHMDGAVAPIPNNPEEFLAYRYGDTWREPLRIYLFNNMLNGNKERFG